MLAKGIAKFKRANGPGSFPYLPKTYLLPDEREELIADWKQGECGSSYILKPRSSARGLGIKLVSDPETISKNANYVACKYIGLPLFTL